VKLVISGKYKKNALLKHVNYITEYTSNIVS